MTWNINKTIVLAAFGIILTPFVWKFNFGADASFIIKLATHIVATIVFGVSMYIKN